jgi:DNA-binding transcriptional MerR regulator
LITRDDHTLIHSETKSIDDKSHMDHRQRTNPLIEFCVISSLIFISALFGLTLELIPDFIMPAVSKKTQSKSAMRESGPLRAGEVARLSGVSPDTLRHYERKGLLKPQRAPNGYREYPRHAVERVRLIRAALAIGFKLDDLERVFKIRDAGGAPCRQVRELAAAKLNELETLVLDLTVMRDEIRELIRDWDRRLDSVAADEPARLLETLATMGLANVRALAPLKPRHSNRAKKEK